MDEFLLQFLKGGTAENLNITQDPELNNFLGVNVRTVLTPRHDTKIGLAVGATEDLYLQTMTSATRIKKIKCGGKTTDGYYALYFDGVKQDFGTTGVLEGYTWAEDYSGGVLFVPNGTVVKLSVTNIGIVPADYESIIFFEEMP